MFRVTIGGTDYIEDFETENEAYDYAGMMEGAYGQGCEDDFLSNPGDYNGGSGLDITIEEI